MLVALYRVRCFLITRVHRFSRLLFLCLRTFSGSSLLFLFRRSFPFISYVSPLFGHVPRAYELWLAVCLASRSSETRKWPRNDSKIIVRPKAEVSVRKEFGEGGAVSSFTDVRYHDDSSVVPASFPSSCWNITEETSDDCHG